ncbi:hypothetical protein FGO68_gene444 [Halteria grandinella]|uniref:Uncharacterized protein n=1 Tax=Halteria grandinella TaxID=5974 RepID=A0A8J8NTH0_HALGN|nr:hypothetical protein FGO68_gene444 [Halteria grandinella]
MHQFEEGREIIVKKGELFEIAHTLQYQEGPQESQAFHLNTKKHDPNRDVFKVENSKYSSNNTSIEKGVIPAILYKEYKEGH